MNSVDANIRDNKTKGQLNSIRENGAVPAIIYGGKEENQKASCCGEAQAGSTAEEGSKEKDCKKKKEKEGSYSTEASQEKTSHTTAEGS